MKAELFIEKWPGPRSLMQSRVADGLRLTLAARDFLVQAGLPIDVGFNGVGFDISGPVARRLASQPSLIQISRPSKGLAAICVDEAHDGRVIQLQSGQPIDQALFLNSSVEQHAECWLAWRTIVDSSAGEADAVTAERLRSTFLAIDAAALAHDEHPWAILIHEVELGIL